MKSVLPILTILFFTLISCENESVRSWKVQLPQEKVELQYHDMSRDFFDISVPLEELKSKYPFFINPSTSDEEWELQRRDTLELEVYDAVGQVFPKYDYQSELEEMFAHYKYYFPNEKIPQVFVYSSGLQKIYEPVIFGRHEGLLFIALDGFLGSQNGIYGLQDLLPMKQPVYPYMLKNMNPENLMPAVVSSVGEMMLPFDAQHLAFVNLMIDEGKKLVLADALLPETSDDLKIGYTKDEIQWAEANEGEIWNYFVEQNLIFDTDKSNRERFLDPSPFSKFRNEIETESPGRIGAWIGWQICRKFMNRHPEISLQDFLMKDNGEIFKESKYKPGK